jgi:hypothetical protein
MDNMSNQAILTTINRLNSRKLRDRLAKLDADRCALVALLRAVTAREKRERAERKAVNRGK